MLRVNDIHVYYGAIHALKGLSFSLERGELVTLLGANGAGKTTTLKTLSGLLRSARGVVELDGNALHKMEAHDIVRRGVYALHCLVPDDKGTGGEFYVRGHGERIDSPHIRALAGQAASYTPRDRYVLFELRIADARCNGYGDVPVPEPASWQVTA